MKTGFLLTRLRNRCLNGLEGAQRIKTFNQIQTLNKNIEFEEEFVIFKVPSLLLNLAPNHRVLFMPTQLSMKFKSFLHILKTKSNFTLLDIEKIFSHSKLSKLNTAKSSYICPNRVIKNDLCKFTLLSVCFH